MPPPAEKGFPKEEGAALERVFGNAGCPTCCLKRETQLRPSSSALVRLDFRNEALNALRMEELLKDSLGPSASCCVSVGGTLIHVGVG